LDGRCHCGGEMRHAFDDLGCLDWGATCCPACAIHLESAVYCRRCAGALLGVEPIRSGGPFSPR
jgi:hypothetical protein